jgi:hypothetical protein
MGACLNIDADPPMEKEEKVARLRTHLIEDLTYSDGHGIPT